MEEYIPLPNFIIFGAYKCGSTSLANLLEQHPDIYLAPSKEPNFFLYDEGEIKPNGQVNSLEFYQHFFQKNSKKVQNEKARGEASVGYLCDSKAPFRIKKLIPNIKLIAILRNPVERCYSQYMFDLRMEVHNHKFMDAINKYRDKGRNDRYINLGMYGKYLHEYLKIFNHEQIKIILFEDFVNNKDQVLKELFSFLEVDDSFRYKPIPKEAVSGVPKNKKLYNFIYEANPIKSAITSIIKPFIPEKVRRNLWKKAINQSLKKTKMSLEDRQKLTEIYREDILKLQTLINRDLSHWLTLPNT